MFRLNDGYFMEIDCPELLRRKRCNILNCLFNHEIGSAKLKKRLLSGADAGRTKVAKIEAGKVEDKKKADEDKKNDEDRKKKDEVKTSSGVDISMIIPKSVSHLQVARSDRTVNTRKISNYLRESGNKFPNKSAVVKEYDLASSSQSPEEYQKRVVEYLEASKEPEKDPKYILPREVIPTPPATLPTRKQYIQTIVNTLKKVDPNLKTPILRAIDEEFKIASSTTSTTYIQVLKKRVYQLAHPDKFKQTKRGPDKSDYLKALKELAILKEKLKLYGYIVNIPPVQQPKEDRVCRRCNNEFKLGDILDPIECHHHPGKMIRKDKNTKVYECCGGIVGGETDACLIAKTHVFYWSNPGEMHWAIPFQRTSETFKPNKDSFEALGIDCEMGYTTKGFELLRITALDFFSGEEVLDVLVRPKGEVLDLNTKWSGIAEIKDEALSFEDLINLLQSVMDPNTILIGHGLENDLNTMRIIHDKIVDTAILYPKHKTTPTFRYPLKYLTFTYLGRTIQTGEHDSSEDSLAAIDVVKYFVNQDLKK